MNQYLIAIYKGEFPIESLNTILKSNSSFSGVTIHTIAISSPSIFTLLVGEEKSQLTTELTDKYYLLTKELQRLEQQDKYYFVYDYKNRKTIDNPNQNCLSLLKINISITKLQSMIQKVKDLKQDVFAGFNISYPGESEILNVDVLISSYLLEVINEFGVQQNLSRDNEHYLYLQQLTESLSKPELCDFVQTRAISVK
ncbi:hypothetical protein QRE66_05230 [Bacillus cereus]|nr:hypothetical protein QRE66_05230 [Bacillus cereus]